MAIELYSTPLFNSANLQAYYRLENVNDSKNSYTLTNVNTVAFNAAKFNNGADFTNNNTNKNLYNTNNMGITGGAITIHCWVKMQAEIGSGLQVFAVQANSTSNVTFEIVYDYNGGTRQLKFERNRNGSGATSVNSAITLGTVNFHMLDLTYDGVNIVAYIDGAQVGTPTAASGNGSVSPGDKIVIGAYADGTLPASCIIDDLAIFNRPLTASEISNLYNGTWNTGGFFNFF